MEKAKHSIAFEAEIDGDGRVQFSRPVAGELRLKTGAKVTVSIAGGVLSKELTAREVSNEEIERIGNVQLEDREQVVKFLLSEGSLSRSGSLRRRVKGRRS